MKTVQFAVGALALALGTTGSAQAAGLLGVVQTFPDITLSTNYLIYDHNGVDADTGLLRVVSNASVLNEGPAAGNSTQTQLYLGSGDTTPDLMLSFRIANGSGALAAGSFEGGNVSIGFGNATASPRFKWDGTVTNFGFQSDGKAFDATWIVTGDQYQNMPATLSQFVNGYRTGGAGGIKISNSTAFTSQSFANDWVFATNASSTAINSYTGGLTAPLKVNSTVAIDVFAVPVPELDSVWMMLIGLAVIAPIVRRRKATDGASA